ncbi:hypothetical protein KIN20_024561 [Parelaphostrongylus tenuis]|uniref:Mesencephalic astrocyte-derived neurotrophic factor homolog n=1 Tax=Parelaphostrongylus tenuis TaxID=148309 RepID=A0AAD5N7Q4_PARTN|nr:hypothetical protein KIN20_024561 [Parelaphostrongylus tenuis]
MPTNVQSCRRPELPVGDADRRVKQLELLFMEMQRRWSGTDQRCQLEFLFVGDAEEMAVDRPQFDRYCLGSITTNTSTILEDRRAHAGAVVRGALRRTRGQWFDLALMAHQAIHPFGLGKLVQDSLRLLTRFSILWFSSPPRLLSSPMMILQLAIVLIAVIGPALSQEQCEVCVKVLKDSMAKVPEADKSKPESIAKVVREHCKDVKAKEHKFCFYIGALPESATSIMGDVSKQLSWSMPPEKVCDKLKSKDAQICELKYDKPLDWSKIDLKKMRVKELKNILNEWGEVCKGCTEKSEFVKKIEELKPKYVKQEL